MTHNVARYRLMCI